MYSPNFVPKKFQEIVQEIQNCHLFKEGWRGKIYRGTLEGKDIIIKTPRNPELLKNIRKEAEILEKVNLKGIGPKLIRYGEDFLIEEFVSGIHMKDILNRGDYVVYDLFENILKQARELDKLNISKDEMHRPYTNIIVSGNRPTLLDFESSKITSNPKNVTQFFSFILSYMRFEIKPKDIEIGIELMRRYKSTYQKQEFEDLIIFFREKKEKIMEKVK